MLHEPTRARPAGLPSRYMRPPLDYILLVTSSIVIFRIQVNSAENAPEVFLKFSLRHARHHRNRVLLRVTRVTVTLQGGKRKNWKRQWFTLENSYLTYREKPEVSSTTPSPHSQSMCTLCRCLKNRLYKFQNDILLGLIPLTGCATRRSNAKVW